ncbi:helix-turn-helix transcriptional regulator [Spirosoma sp.]|uniref:helix-turn-helix domain-containing protein n=1 Tax=Spirosoma sp. TaxID=1899569 RepID=UPI002608BB12|nr:helix-turn-helix transcriptional regulator [Spirosoma sp.]MCX6219242.1 helix-turn-helix transcriptional regulator [Spirosoma sp.]
MKIEFSVDVLVGLFIINVGFFAAGLLWFSAYNRQANRFLACLMVALSCWLIDGFFRVAGIYQQNANLYFLPIFYSFAFGPLIYIYVNSLTNSAFQFKRSYWWHFLPVAVQAGLYLFLTLQSYEFRNWFWNNIHYPYTYSIEFDGTWISLLIYLLLSLRLLRNYSRYVQENFSETSQLTLRWLRILLVIIALVCGQWAIELILRHRFNLYFQYDYSYWLLGLLLIMLGTAGLQQTNLANVQFRDEAIPDSLPLLPKSEVQISPEQVDQVRRAMDTDKLYLNPTLTLTELARHLGLNPKVVSLIINAGIGQSFNNFVNSYRISEVKQRLRTDDLTRFTLLGIAFESGFNSKTTFNRIFKEHTGQSPSEYAGQT